MSIHAVVLLDAPLQANYISNFISLLVCRKYEARKWRAEVLQEKKHHRVLELEDLEVICSNTLPVQESIAEASLTEGYLTIVQQP